MKASNPKLKEGDSEKERGWGSGVGMKHNSVL